MARTQCPNLTYTQTLRYIPSKSVKFEICPTVTSTTDIRLVLNSLWPLPRPYINKGITHSRVTKGHIQMQRRKVNNSARKEEKKPKSRKNKMVNKNRKNSKEFKRLFYCIFFINLFFLFIRSFSATYPSLGSQGQQSEYGDPDAPRPLPPHGPGGHQGVRRTIGLGLCLKPLKSIKISNALLIFPLDKNEARPVRTQVPHWY